MPNYRLFGVDSSPYTAKIRAVLRYRRLPHHWICRFPQMHDETRHVRPAVMPVVQFPDGSYRSDSTPILLAMESDRPGERSILPDDPGHAFVARVIEDLADEWIAKCLFHFRFAEESDARYAARWVMSDAHTGAADTAVRGPSVEAFRARQVGRRVRIGCTEANAPLIETTYERVLQILEGVVGNERFLFGSRPSLADFGLYAQLRTLASDPTPQARMRRDAPYTEHWLRRLDDASGVEGDWDPESLAADRAAVALLHLAGEVYLPFLAANARAIEAGAETLHVRLAGRDYTQPPFGYQKKCLESLRAALAELPAATRDALRPTLEATACWATLQPGA